MIGEFRTQDGRCIVAENRLLLKVGERRLVGTLREALTDDDISPARRVGVGLFLVAIVAGVAFGLQAAPAWLSGTAVGLLLAGVVWTAYRRRQRSTDDVSIPFADIESVEPQYGIPLLTRPRFVIRYRSEGGVKQRYLLCPSRLFGFGAYECGKELFMERGLLATDETPQPAEH